MSKETVNAICIPQDGSYVHIATLDKIPLDELPPTGGQTSDTLETILKSLPGLAAYDDWYNYAFLCRRLVDLGDMNPDHSILERHSRIGPYFMYRFANNAHKILATRPDIVRPNQHFKKVDGGTVVYGSVCIFKIDKVGGVPMFRDVDESFIRHAFKGKGIMDAESLMWLSMQGLTLEERESLERQA